MSANLSIHIKLLFMKILRNKNLKNHNTLGLNVFAKYYASTTNKAELSALLRNTQYSGLPRMVLGAGSNVLFTSDYDGFVIHPAMSEIEVTSEDDNDMFIRVGAGVVWDDLVKYTVDKGWGGLENL